MTEPPLKNWRQGGYLEKDKVPKDPWDNDFIYLSPGAHGDYDLSSLGADGAELTHRLQEGTVRMVAGNQVEV